MMGSWNPDMWLRRTGSARGTSLGSSTRAISYDMRLRLVLGPVRDCRPLLMMADRGPCRTTINMQHRRALTAETQSLQQRLGNRHSCWITIHCSHGASLSLQTERGSDRRRSPVLCAKVPFLSAHTANHIHPYVITHTTTYVTTYTTIYPQARHPRHQHTTSAHFQRLLGKV